MLAEKLTGVNAEKLYYVYMYSNPVSGVPFYVGKGKCDRYLHHLNEAKKANSNDRNLHKISTIRQILNSGVEPEIVIVDSGICEDQAFELEEFLISEIGRRNLHTGTLTNMTNGGEGLSGLNRDLSGANNPNYGKRGESSIWWGRTHTQATKDKQSLSQAGKELTEAHKAAMRKPKSEAGRAAIAKARKESSYRPSAETRLKLSVAMKLRGCDHLLGKPLSESHRAKISAGGKGKTKPKSLCPHCERMISNNTIQRFHLDNCKEKVNVI